MDVEAALESVDPNEVRGDPAGKGKHESSRAALGTLSLSLSPPAHRVRVCRGLRGRVRRVWGRQNEDVP